MGLGVGINCETCGDQLNYDEDTAEIIEYTTASEAGLDESIEVKKRPVLCHDCRKVIQAYGRLLSGA